MIITRLIGGLGNQMFQYAAGRRTSLKNGSTLKLDIDGFNTKTVDTPRKYMLDVFNIKAEIASKDEIKKIKKMHGTFAELVIANRIPRLHHILFPVNNNYFLENSNLAFEEKVLRIKGDAYLEGWWQSEKYFKDISDIIRKDFTFKIKPNRVNAQILEKIKSCNSLSVHVRRGDYVSNKNYHSYFAYIETDYFKKAVNMIAKKETSLNIFIFSDDPVWVKKNLKFKFPTTYVENNVGKADYEDLRLMSACRHNIIVNSSFSWWGAWLNNNSNKIVIAPSKWFRKQELSISDRIPKSWIKL